MTTPEDSGSSASIIILPTLAPPAFVPKVPAEVLNAGWALMFNGLLVVSIAKPFVFVIETSYGSFELGKLDLAITTVNCVAEFLVVEVADIKALPSLPLNLTTGALSNFVPVIVNVWLPVPSPVFAFDGEILEKEGACKVKLLLWIF